jgi:hypothetical protein
VAFDVGWKMIFKPKIGSTVIICKKQWADGPLPIGTSAVVQEVVESRHPVLAGLWRVRLDDYWYDKKSIRRATVPHFFSSFW